MKTRAASRQLGKFALDEHPQLLHVPLGPARVRRLDRQGHVGKDAGPSRDLRQRDDELMPGHMASHLRKNRLLVTAIAAATPTA